MDRSHDSDDSWVRQLVRELRPSAVSLLRPASWSRYDLVLVTIPLAFALAGAAALTGVVSVELALAGAAVMASASVGDALFIHPPTGDRRGATERGRRGRHAERTGAGGYSSDD